MHGKKRFRDVLPARERPLRQTDALQDILRDALHHALPRFRIRTVHILVPVRLLTEICGETLRGTIQRIPVAEHEPAGNIHVPGQRHDKSQRLGREIAGPRDAPPRSSPPWRLPDAMDAHGTNEFLHGLFLKPGTRRSPRGTPCRTSPFSGSPAPFPAHQKPTQFLKALRVLFHEFPVDAGPRCPPVRRRSTAMMRARVLPWQYGQPQISLPRGRRPEGDSATMRRMPERRAPSTPSHSQKKRLASAGFSPKSTSRRQSCPLRTPSSVRSGRWEIRQRTFLPVTENPGKTVTAARIAEAVCDPEHWACRTWPRNHRPCRDQASPQKG